VRQPTRAALATSQESAATSHISPMGTSSTYAA
jgi:hypothetical protein